METLSSRRKQAQKSSGSDNTNKQNAMKKAIYEEEQRRLAKQRKKKELIEGSWIYRLTNFLTKVMDKCFLDPIIGLIPGVGDFITSVAQLPAIYLCLFKIRSIPLTLAVVFNTVRDMLIGMIPFWIGNILDFFHRSHIQNLRLIVGFIDDDKAIIEEVNKKAVWTAILIGIFCFLIYALVVSIKFLIDARIAFIKNIMDWIHGLF